MNTKMNIQNMTDFDMVQVQVWLEPASQRGHLAEK